MRPGPGARLPPGRLQDSLLPLLVLVGAVALSATLAGLVLGEARGEALAAATPGWLGWVVLAVAIALALVVLEYMRY